MTSQYTLITPPKKNNENIICQQLFWVGIRMKHNLSLSFSWILCIIKAGAPVTKNMHKMRMGNVVCSHILAHKSSRLPGLPHRPSLLCGTPDNHLPGHNYMCQVIDLAWERILWWLIVHMDQVILLRHEKWYRRNL